MTVYAEGSAAVRIVVRGEVQGVGFREATMRQAMQAGRFGLGAKRSRRQRGCSRRG